MCKINKHKKKQQIGKACACVCVCFSREGKVRYLWTWSRDCLSSSAPVWVASSFPPAITMSQTSTVLLLWLLLANVLQGVLMKADVEGEIRVKCFMPSCSGEEWKKRGQLSLPVTECLSLSLQHHVLLLQKYESAWTKSSVLASHNSEVITHTHKTSGTRFDENYVLCTWNHLTEKPANLSQFCTYHFYLQKKKVSIKTVMETQQLAGCSSSLPCPSSHHQCCMSMLTFPCLHLSLRRPCMLNALLSVYAQKAVS